MAFRINPLLLSDSYKYSHPAQYPDDTSGMSSYISARSDNSGFKVKKVTWFGPQGHIKDYLLTPITEADIVEAKFYAQCNGIPFPEAGFRKILTHYKGFMPFKIKALKEGTQVPIGVPMMVVEKENDPDVFWACSWIETQLLRAAWYGSTVATISRVCKEIIFGFLQETSDSPIDGLAYKLNDFGARGASSAETAMIGGSAHLVNFKGTDTICALPWVHQNYSADPADIGHSVPAAEHATISAWSRSRETEAYRNMIKQFGNTYPIYAVVSDTYNIFEACETKWGEELKDEVLNASGTLVVRPDSGDPISTVLRVVGILASKFGYTRNSRGYKILNKVRVIQGDGINPDSIRAILTALKINNYSADNVAFGMGGALLQGVTRDTFGFAQKASSVTINGQHIDVYKDPIAGGKTSLKGRMSVTRVNGELTAVRRENLMGEDALELVYDHGKLIRDQTFNEIRALAAI